MITMLLWAIAGFLFLYMGLPFILTRVLGLGVFRQSRTQGTLALTFDDGPDPQYTPQLLDLLKRYGVRATFFVVGAKAKAHPELIRRIVHEGHQLGIHNYRHLPNWLLSPWNVARKQVHATAELLAEITGSRPTLYRPPWGILNLFDLWLARRYRLVLWSVMVGDWRSQVGPALLKQRLEQAITDGSVVVLHDSGQTFGADADAPAAMLAALDQLLGELTASGRYSCLGIEEMLSEEHATMTMANLTRFKKSVVRLWMLWERLFIRMFHLEPVDRSNPFLRLRMREYHGHRTITLADGETIARGDRVLELHLDNELLFELGVDAHSEVQLAIQLIRRTEQLLPLISRLLLTKPEYRDVKGLYGVSIIHRGSKRLGFTVLDLPGGMFSLLTRWYLRLLMSVIHPAGRDRLRRPAEQLVPKIIAISRKELVNRYIA